MEFLAGFGGCTGIDHGGLDRDYSMPYAIGGTTHAKWSVVNDNDHSGTRGEKRESERERERERESASLVA